MMQPRERRFQRTKQAILDAALEIIREEGPGALNMRALAERSDYSAAGLYEYFGGKDEIIAEVCEQGHERLASHMRQADASLPVVDYLYEIGIGYIRFALENPDHFLLMFTVVPPGPARTSRRRSCWKGTRRFTSCSAPSAAGSRKGCSGCGPVSA